MSYVISSTRDGNCWDAGVSKRREGSMKISDGGE